MTRLDRITSDPAICHGKATIRGLRYPVASLLEVLASDMATEDVLEDHPDLERGRGPGSVGGVVLKVVPEVVLKVVRATTEQIQQLVIGRAISGRCIE